MFKNLNPSALGVTGHQSEIIELALSYGFGGMDLNVVEFATRARLKGVPYARRLMDSAKIELGTFQLPLEWDTDDATFEKDLKKLPEYAQAAVEAGCKRCVATLAPGGDKRPYHENFEFHRRRFQEICHALEPSGIRLGVGFLGAEYLRKNLAFQFIHDLDALTLLVNMIGVPNIGLLLDVWDVMASGGSEDMIRKIPSQQIVAVQVANLPTGVASSDLDDKSRLVPGAENGRLDLSHILTILKNDGFDGPVTPKPSRGLIQSRRRDMVVKQVGDGLEKVWRAAGLQSERRFVPSAPADDYIDI
jgi:sugar phosphate isomerase/epimerase